MHKALYLTVMGVGAVALGAFAASFFITAPGAKLGDEPVGWTTPTALATTLQDRLEATEVQVGEVTYSPGDLGISLDKTLLQEELAGLTLIPGGFNPTVESLPLQVNEVDLTAKLHEDNPEVFYAPTDSTVSFSESLWHAVPSKPGVTLSMEKLMGDLETALLKGEETVSFTEAMAQEIEPAIKTEATEALVNSANTMLETAGVYSGETKLLSISPEQLNEWLTFGMDEAGAFVVTVDEGAVTDFYGTLPKQLNKSPVDGVAVTDETGKRIHTLEEWSDGFRLTSAYDSSLPQVLANLQGLTKAHFTVEGEVIPANVNELYRRIEVDLAARKVMTYENETLVKTYPMAVGKPSTPTFAGEFRVGWQTPMQDMGCGPAVDYCTEDVKWVSYFNGDQAFHGTYWHNDFGDPNGSARSHGCVNMTEADALELYRFAQAGTPVSVY